MALYSSILAWKISPWGHKESDTIEKLSTELYNLIIYIQIDMDWMNG